jgi:nucleotide-binding universal stress UspA family protein
MTCILLPVDGSKHSLRTTRKLIEIAQQWRDRPTILPLYVHLPVPRFGGLTTVVGSSAIQRYYREEGEQALAPALKLLAKAGHDAKPEILVGHIAETIVAQAKKNKCDFICLGTHGMGAAVSLVMGSVATKVLHLADVPVILVR